MKVIIRRSNKGDMDGIYECHKECFKLSDHWYKSAIQQYVDKSYVIELDETRKIIGVLLQGPVIPCGASEVDSFIPITENGKLYIEKQTHLETNMGISMLCIHPEYRKKGLAKKLIQLHIKENPDKLLCLNTRSSNPAYNLYLKMGYEHIVIVKNKYYFPTEDSYFMVKGMV